MNVHLLSQLGGNVAAPLQQLADAGIKPVDLGGDTIAGTAVEHLQLKYSDEDLFPHSTDHAGRPVTTLDLWIDDTNHERRAEITKPAWSDAGSSSPAEHSITDFSDYGTGVHVEAPDPGDTVSFTAFNHWMEQFVVRGISLPQGAIVAVTTSTTP
jgi:hypothetical protein